MALNNIIRSTCMTCVLAHLFHKKESAIKNNVTIVLISSIYSVVSGEGPLPLLGHNKSGSLDSKIWVLATIKKMTRFYALVSSPMTWSRDTSLTKDAINALCKSNVITRSACFKWLNSAYYATLNSNQRLNTIKLWSNLELSHTVFRLSIFIDGWISAIWGEQTKSDFVSVILYLIEF